MKRLSLSFVCILILTTAWGADPKLTGTPIGSSPSVDYSQSGSPSSTTVNLPEDAFDGDMNTFYASYERTHTWVGLDLGECYVITRAGWAPRNDVNGPKRMLFGRIEGANQPDFSDAIPLHIIGNDGEIGHITYADITNSRGFRYVRYVGPKNARCNISELEFYGHPGNGDDHSILPAGGLPLVVINTVSGLDPVDKVNELPCVVTITDESGHILTDSAEVRLRGNGSMTFAKKPYRFKFRSKHHVLGSPAKAKKWTLINNYGDKTLMRNMVAFRISQLMGMPYTPFCQPVNVYMNGDFKGCYQLCDQVQVHKNRVDIEEMTPQDNREPAIEGGYFIEIDAYAYDEPEGHYFYSDWYNPVTIKSPSDSITNAQRTYIKNVFNTMENAVYYLDNWRRYLDEETFLKHFLVGELSGNTDTYWSVYMYKHRGDIKLYTGPVWDMDLGFENDYRTFPINNLGDYIYATNGSVAGNMRDFVNQIIKNDPATSATLSRLWSQARNHGLTADYLITYIDSVANVLDEAQQLNFTRWPIMNEYVHENPQITGSYQGEVNVVKQYIRQRIPWMDEHVGNKTYNPEVTTSDWDGESITVWNIRGELICSGKEIPHLAPGLYIIQRGNTFIKAILP